MWNDLYEKHYQELRRYAGKSCGNDEEAEDLVQEVFLKALQNAALFEELGQSQRRAWLYRTLKNELYDRYRHFKMEEGYLQNQKQIQDAYQEPGIQKIENAMLLSLLNEEDRILFHLRYEEGYQASELAQLFSLSPGTVRSKLSRTRKLLKFMMEE